MFTGAFPNIKSEKQAWCLSMNGKHSMIRNLAFMKYVKMNFMKIDLYFDDISLIEFCGDFSFLNKFGRSRFIKVINTITDIGEDIVEKDLRFEIYGETFEFMNDFNDKGVHKTQIKWISPKQLNNVDHDLCANMAVILDMVDMNWDDDNCLQFTKDYVKFTKTDDIEDFFKLIEYFNECLENGETSIIVKPYDNKPTKMFLQIDSNIFGDNLTYLGYE